MTGGAAFDEAAARPADVLAFWRAAGADKWFEKSEVFDLEVRRRFFSLWHTARAGELAHWEGTPEGALALVIALDQFPRNMFRDDRRTYATDELARGVAERAIGRGFDQQVSHPERQFFYLPFMHSENLADHERCLELARRYGDDEFGKYAEQHYHPPLWTLPASQRGLGPRRDAGGASLSH
jgi:uncharacterized protein (DUF924 family)